MPALPPPSSAPVVLYDGDCGFCARSVQFILRRDRRGVFRFAALQSPAAARLLRSAGRNPDPALTTFVLIENGVAYDRSTAALRIARKLDALWPLAYAFIVVPRAWRDPLYDLVATRRHRLAPPSCLLPTPDTRERFLNE